MSYFNEYSSCEKCSITSITINQYIPQAFIFSIISTRRQFFFDEPVLEFSQLIVSVGYGCIL